MTDLKNKLAPEPQKEQKNIRQWITTMKPEIEKALPAVITPERFTRMALTAISVNPKLAECTPSSFMGALMSAAQLGLEPNTPLGQAYLIPYRNNRNKGTMEASFQLGYKGLIDLAHRSGEFREIYAVVVHENDDFEYEFGLDRKLEHRPSEGERGGPTHVYAVYKLVNGGFGFEVMTMSEVKKHAQRFSKSVGNGPWVSDFNEMAKKTVLKKVLKYAPIKVEFQREMATDATIKHDLSENMTDVQGDNVFEAEYETYEEGTETNKVSPS